MASSEINTFSTQPFSTESPIPIPQINKKVSDYANNIKISETGLFLKEVHLAQLVVFTENAWAYMQCDGTYRDSIAEGFHANAAKNVHERIRLFFKHVFQLMASDNVSTANLCLRVINGFTVSDRSVRVEEQQVTVNTNGQVTYNDAERGTLTVKRLSQDCVQRHFNFPSESDRVVIQKTFIISADNKSKDSTKKHEAALITFLGDVPFQPDSVSYGSASTYTESEPRPAAYNFLPQITMVRSSGRASIRSSSSSSSRSSSSESTSTSVRSSESDRVSGRSSDRSRANRLIHMQFGQSIQTSEPPPAYTP